MCLVVPKYLRIVFNFKMKFENKYLIYRKLTAQLEIFYLTQI